MSSYSAIWLHSVSLPFLNGQQLTLGHGREGRAWGQNVIGLVSLNLGMCPPHLTSFTSALDCCVICIKPWSGIAV